MQKTYANVDFFNIRNMRIIQACFSSLSYWLSCKPFPIISVTVKTLFSFFRLCGLVVVVSCGLLQKFQKCLHLENLRLQRISDTSEKKEDDKKGSDHQPSTSAGGSLHTSVISQSPMKQHRDMMDDGGPAAKKSRTEESPMSSHEKHKSRTVTLAGKSSDTSSKKDDDKNPQPTTSGVQGSPDGQPSTSGVQRKHKVASTQTGDSPPPTKKPRFTRSASFLEQQESTSSTSEVPEVEPRDIEPFNTAPGPSKRSVESITETTRTEKSIIEESLPDSDDSDSQKLAIDTDATTRDSDSNSATTDSYSKSETSSESLQEALEHHGGDIIEESPPESDDSDSQKLVVDTDAASTYSSSNSATTDSSSNSATSDSSSNSATTDSSSNSATTDSSSEIEILYERLQETFETHEEHLGIQELQRGSDNSDSQKPFIDSNPENTDSPPSLD